MERKIKAAKTLLIILGILLLVRSLRLLGAISVIKLLEDIPKMHDILTKQDPNALLFSPAFLIIGLTFLLLGIFIRKIRRGKLLIHIIASVLSVACLVLQLLFIANTNILSELNTDQSLDDILRIFFGIVHAFRFTLYLVPEIIIAILLYKIERKPAGT